MNPHKQTPTRLIYRIECSKGIGAFGGYNCLPTQLPPREPDNDMVFGAQSLKNLLYWHAMADCVSGHFQDCSVSVYRVPLKAIVTQPRLRAPHPVSWMSLEGLAWHNREILFDRSESIKVATIEMCDMISKIEPLFRKEVA